MRYFMEICCYWFFKIKKNKEITLQNWQSLKHHQALTQKVPTHNRAKTQHKTSPLSKTHYILMRYTFVLKVMHYPPSSLNWWNHTIATMNRNVFYSVHPPINHRYHQSQVRVTGGWTQAAYFWMRLYFSW